ncbi:aspartate--tRNA ligase [Candidatus Woesearchaeota archaeon]|nr:aspartate--tRNA ligase [Candidatus Woesearchaeota archaeon]
MAFTLIRTHKNNELDISDNGKEVVLNGWVNSARIMGGLIFIDLRDRYGLTQVVFDSSEGKGIFSQAQGLKKEEVIAVMGIVRPRAKGQANPNRKTGEIEVIVKAIEILGRVSALPMDMDENAQVTDETRLRFRYLDLRKRTMQKNLKLRHDIKMLAHEYFSKNDFIEVETPLLVRSTPEGARDYLVPSRVNTGRFYALPQSPQLYKQLLMIAGVDRYYQIAHCLRDEDLRADRQPEHTQIDFEMSFVRSSDIMGFVNGFFKKIFKDILDIEMEDAPVISFDESMERFGTDKPDLRYGLELFNITDAVRDSAFGVFNAAAENSGVVKGLVADKEFSRKEIDELTELCKACGAKGLVALKASGGKIDGSIAKYLSEDEKREILRLSGAKEKECSTVFIVADDKSTANASLDRLRRGLAERLGLVKKDEFRVCWIVDFPLFEWDNDEKHWSPAHHMFSMPKPEHIELLEKDPGRIKADLFDLVLNGTELGSGSIRIHDPDIQKRVMKVIGLDEKEAEKKFGFLLEAYKYGAPIHGGMGIGLDRLVALVAGLTDIREVIAFPKNKAAQCPMDGSPNEIDSLQLKELGMKLDIDKKK